LTALDFCTLDPRRVALARMGRAVVIMAAMFREDA